MTKSTITREQLEEWVAQFDEDGGCDATDMQLEALIRQSLAAMDSESGCLPLDYLQGHKDGLGWAAQLAEANHPETGDWLYDDPIELAKAIRKGPDMPPVRPAADSEPVALQPELAKVIYHFRDWNEGFPVERFKADYVISWMLANYPPAPPAPVVSADLLHTAASAIEDLLTTKDRTGACVWFDLPFRLRSAANAQPVTVVPDKMTAIVKDEAEYVEGWNACRAAMLAADPQLPGSDPATVPGKWIPVSEQMPPSRHEVLVGCWWGEKPRWCCKWATYIPCHPDAQSSGWLIPGASWTPTHWMELPAAPQEPKP
ncbi:TPA: DUF551 domain-containing protein [Klebsiella pneumoniae]|uniref:DUF551 domain-containing protein n=1 Tax=Klebsiella pneumoniae TaxID=573 RepID=UPI00041DBB3A|nr:DUF551 domain-containing protein [Klebsiella pneumoniae]HBT2356257.1 DUF551 domain-containing protein [Klebsiella pneumoniae subsp. pneumoniae]ALK14667.1 hypothetical protein KLP1_19290 [Klebsiella pneumoniae KP-1]EIW9306213.1 DUF551 domain-containing protein [Klebsiella pneumoniae]MDK9882238.1 DUF551 domain-containing protein [Klebsiella pneumoniae]MDN0137266.1 DUF551 domain-containing protein [Klebsiella pneumoniae]